AAGSSLLAVGLPSAVPSSAVLPAGLLGLVCRALRSRTGGLTGPDLRSAMPEVLARTVHDQRFWSRAKDKASPNIASSLGCSASPTLTKWALSSGSATASDRQSTPSRLRMAAGSRW